MKQLKYPAIKNRELHRIVATAIIHKDHKFLITKRSLDKKLWPGRWTVPGGGVEIDDYIATQPTTKNTIWYFALENTLRREVKEEVGLEIGEVSYLLDLAFIRTADNTPVITLSFYAPWKKGKVRLDKESSDFVWVTARQVKNYDLIEGIPQEIQMVDRILKGKNPRSVRFR